MAEWGNGGWRNDKMVMAERRNGGKATYRIYLIYLRYTPPTRTPTPTPAPKPFNHLYPQLRRALRELPESSQSSQSKKMFNHNEDD